jgi:DNA-binding response OmpR family regulator
MSNGQVSKVHPAAATVLVVDDDDALRGDLAENLAVTFDRVLEVPSAELALYVLGTHAVDVVATTARLPGMSAEALCAELVRHSGPPIVAYGVPGDGANRARWFEAGGSDCMGGAHPALVAARCRSVVRRGGRAASGARRRLPRRVSRPHVLPGVLRWR